ncbi:MAG: hypothetical protein AAF798_02365 [Bacteroidota bacterium]
MKIIKFATIFALTFLVTTTLVAQQAEKTLVKAFNLQGHDLIQIELDGPVEVRTWKQNILRVQMVIKLENGSENLLKSLVQIGRYNLKSGIGEQGFHIFAPNMKREVKIGGKVINESLTYVIYAPEGVQVKLPNTASTQVVEVDSSL